MKDLLLIFIFIFPVRAAIPSIGDSNMIEKTCRQTPYYQLCVWSLVSNPQSFSSDVVGLAKIMIHTLDAKASRTLGRINELIEQSSSSSSGGHDQKKQQELRTCADRYIEILKADVPQALQALSGGDVESARENSFDAAMEAISCEEEFSSGQSPLSDMNMKVHDLAVVAAAIVKQIHSG